MSPENIFGVLGGLPDAEAFPKMLNAVTGWSMTLEDIQQTGERIANIRQAFNIREGLNFMAFKVPGRIEGDPPQAQGPLEGMKIDENIYPDFLKAMDWDLKTCKPSKARLLELDMPDVAEQLYPSCSVIRSEKRRFGYGKKSFSENDYGTCQGYQGVPRG